MFELRRVQKLNLKKLVHRVWTSLIATIFSLALTFVSTAVGTYSADEDVQTQISKKESEARQLLLTWNFENYSTAHALFAEAAELSGYQRIEAARLFRKAARISLVLGNQTVSEAEVSQAQEHDLHENNSAGIVEDESILLLIKIRFGDAETAETLYSKLCAQNFGSMSPATAALATYSCGEYVSLYGGANDMLKFFGESLSMATEAGHAEMISEASLKLGYGYIRQGDPITAQEFIERALEHWIVSGDRRGTAKAYFGLGFVKSTTGEKYSALESYRKSEALFPDDMDEIEKGKLFNGIATIYEEFSDYPAALVYRTKAIRLFEIGNYASGRLATLPSVAELFYLGGDRIKAKAALSDAESLALQLGQNFWLGVVNEIYGDMALVENNPSAAEIRYKTALKVYSDLGIELPRTRNGLGLALEKMQNPKAAEDEYSKALERNLETKDLLYASLNFFNLARLARARGDSETALGYANRSLALTTALHRDINHSGLRRGFISSISERYDFAVNLLFENYRATRDTKSVSTALQTLEFSKALSILEDQRFSGVDFRGDGDPSIVKKERDILIRLNSMSDRLTDLLGNDTTNELETLTNQIRDIENQLEEVRAELKVKSPIYSAIKNPERFDVADFQREVLDEDSLLLEFSLGKEESYLWAVDKADVTAYYLPAREQIEARVERLRSLLGARQLKQGESFEDYQKRMADAEVEYKSEARALSNDLLGQAKDKLAGKKLIVVADGRLHYFPLGSLPMPGDESDDPILLTNEVVYEPSASALKIFRMEKKAEAKPQKDLLVFADPVFSKSDERIAGLDTSNSGFVSTILSTFRSIESLESMPRLPASREEAKSISDVVGAGQTTVRSGFAANRDGVLNGGIQDYKILHFATHGLIDEKRPELSGILLSLFNESGNENDGGFIRLQDVYGLRLNSDLVVLSACDTGIGKEIKGEGVMSLNNAFLQAGAKSVVSSLWKVDDTATKDLMTEFYRGMADDNLTAAAALRQAQIKMYNDPRYRSPFYWAAFTASGDDRVKVAFASNARLYGLIAVAIVFAAVLAFVALRRRSRRPKFPAQ